MNINDNGKPSIQSPDNYIIKSNQSRRYCRNYVRFRKSSSRSRSYNSWKIFHIRSSIDYRKKLILLILQIIALFHLCSIIYCHQRQLSLTVKYTIITVVLFNILTYRCVQYDTQQAEHGELLLGESSLLFLLWYGGIIGGGLALLIEKHKHLRKESPYILLRLMDLKLHEWKPDMLSKIEKTLDSELKYTDEKKGIACKSISFEQDEKYPQQDGRFLNLNIRGICTDDDDKPHTIDKDLITKAIIRRKDEVNAVIGAIVFRIGNVKLYERNRNKLNLIIIPVSIGFVTFLFVLTFFLRRMRAKQKRDHIILELQKKKEASAKKAQVIANIDPHANDKQRLLQLDPTVVGNVSDTMGSPKEFTMEQYSPSIRGNALNTSDNRFYNRDYQGKTSPSVMPSKENRTSYFNRDDETSFPTQRTLKSSRERMHVPYENETHFSPVHSQYQYESQHPDMVSMHEQHPRVVVRSIRDDGSNPIYHQQPYDESSQNFVSIPVQIEHSAPYQRFVAPPYHSDPYYPHTNS
ncbi:unnamed protein product [Rotaria sp. Silwood1]|nr:unnamed protein product [Rotaria sp. Silwood1]CAF3354903.1 unnamed protein product [Rotaria sp. Silwood1]CAF4645474.1 unnamed protein product [Rotaria sp. Silwood1]